MCPEIHNPVLETEEKHDYDVSKRIGVKFDAASFSKTPIFLLIKMALKEDEVVKK